MKKRIITGITLIAVLIPIFTIEILFPAFLLVMALLTIVGAFEMLMMFNKEEHIPKSLSFITLLLTVLFYLGLVFSTNLASLEIVEKYFYVIDLRVAIFFITVVLFMIIVFLPNHKMTLLNSTITTIIYIGVSFSSITILRMIGVRFLLYLFIITVMTDMFAYFIGIKFGKRKLAPVTSPKKSIEGAIAGSVAGTIFASLFALFFDIYPSSLNPDGLQTIFTGFSQFGELSRGLQALVVIPVTFLATIVSQIGDLIGSKFKRTYDIKDFGKIFPGHGGVVDRFDSAMFTSIFLVLLLTLAQVVFPL